jgi:hypothetical protein
MGGFTTALLDQGTGAVRGLDESVIIPPRRLHLTLGVMSLSPDDDARATTADTDRVKTPAEAVALLSGLRPRIMDILGSRKLRVRLERMEVMKPERGDSSRAHVLWVGPGEEGAGTLREVCGACVLRLYLDLDFDGSTDLVNRTFVDAGFVPDDHHRALKVRVWVVLLLNYYVPGGLMGLRKVALHDYQYDIQETTPKGRSTGTVLVF